MTYNVDINYDINECEQLEREINDLLAQVPDTDGAERRNLLREIEAKVQKAKEYVASIQMEALDITDPDEQDHYNEEYENHNLEINRLDDMVKKAGKDAQAQEKARASGVSTQDLMKKATDLQEIQKQSLNNSIATINTIKQTGEDTLVEIQRQKDILEGAQQNMVEMDSELGRARKILKVMVTRAAGDNCVRILALLVLLSVLAVIIVECVKPGAVKKQVDGWFSSDTDDDLNAGSNPTPTPAPPTADTGPESSTAEESSPEESSPEESSPEESSPEESSSADAGGGGTGDNEGSGGSGGNQGSGGSGGNQGSGGTGGTGDNEASGDNQGSGGNAGDSSGSNDQPNSSKRLKTLKQRKYISM